MHDESADRLLPAWKSSKPTSHQLLQRIGGHQVDDVLSV